MSQYQILITTTIISVLSDIVNINVTTASFGSIEEAACAVDIINNQPRHQRSPFKQVAFCLFTAP